MQEEDFRMALHYFFVAGAKQTCQFHDIGAFHYDNDTLRQMIVALHNCGCEYCLDAALAGLADRLVD